MSSKGADRDAVALQHEPVVFQVLADLEDGRVLAAAGFRAASASAERDLARHEAAAEEVGIAAVLERDVGRAARLERERDADEVGLHGDRARSSRCRAATMPALARLARPRVQAVEARDRLVGVDVEGLRGGGRRDLPAQDAGVPTPSCARRGAASGRSRPAKGSASPVGVRAGLAEERRLAGGGAGAALSGRRQVIASPPGRRRGSGSIAARSDS